MTKDEYTLVYNVNYVKWIIVKKIFLEYWKYTELTKSISFKKEVIKDLDGCLVLQYIINKRRIFYLQEILWVEYHFTIIELIKEL